MKRNVSIESISSVSSGGKRKRRRGACLTERGDRTRKISRLQIDRNRSQQRIANETEEARLARLDTQRERTQQLIVNETNEDRLARLETDRLRFQHRVANETPEQTQTRRANNAESQRVGRAQRSINEQLNGAVDELNEINGDDNDDTDEVNNRPDQRVDRNVRANNNFHKAAYSNFDRVVNVATSNLGRMSLECGHCGALYFESERNTRRNFTGCCMNGKIAVPHLPAAHTTIQYLVSTPLQDIEDQDEREELKIFRKKVRNYNGLFAFAGIHMRLDNPQGAYAVQRAIVRIHGQLYSYIPPGDSNGGHANTTQFYFLETEVAQQERMRQTDYFTPARRLINMILEMLVETNPYLSAFRCYREIIGRAESNNVQAHMYLVRKNPSELTINGNFQINRFDNNAVSGEVAAVFTDSDGALGRDLHVPLFVYYKRKVYLKM